MLTVDAEITAAEIISPSCFPVNLLLLIQSTEYEVFEDMRKKTDNSVELGFQ